MNYWIILCFCLFQINLAQNDNCKDESKFCSRELKRYNCGHPWMNVYCKKTCDLCGSTEHSKNILLCVDPNAEFLECGSACPVTCDSPDPACPLVCEPRCQCNKGYLEHQNRCIKAEDCPLSWVLGGEECREVKCLMKSCPAGHYRSYKDLSCCGTCEPLIGSCTQHWSKVMLQEIYIDGLNCHSAHPVINVVCGGNCLSVSGYDASNNDRLYEVCSCCKPSHKGKTQINALMECKGSNETAPVVCKTYTYFLEECSCGACDHYDDLKEFSQYMVPELSTYVHDHIELILVDFY